MAVNAHIGGRYYRSAAAAAVMVMVKDDVVRTCRCMLHAAVVSGWRWVESACPAYVPRVSRCHV